MRASIAAVIWLLALPAAAQVNLNAANGTVFTVQDRTGGQLTAPAAFDNWPGLCVRACVDCDGPCDAAETYSAGGQASASELNGLQRVLATAQLAGLEVRRKVFVPNAGPARANGFVRYVDFFTNPTDQAIAVSIRIGSTGAGVGRLGAGAEAAARRTSDDDAEIETRDRWILIDDDSANGGVGSLAHLIHGAGSRARPERTSLRFADPNDGAAFAWEYRNLVIGPQETVALLTAVVHEPSRADALPEVNHLVGMPSDVLFGLTDAERRSIYNFDVDPDNASPVADAGGPYSAPEGQQVQLSAVDSVDSDAQELQYFWDTDGDDAFDDAVGVNAVVTFRDNGIYEVRVRVTDSGGKSDIDTGRVVVVNVAPRVDGVITDPLPIEEGTELQVDVQAVDPGADTLTFDFDWDGDGTFEELDVQNHRWQHRYLTDGDFRAVVRVEDGDGGSTVREFPVEVTNAAPQIFDVVSNTPAPEGATVTLNVVAQDPGDDPMNFEYDLDGDGAYEVAGIGLSRVETTFPDDGLFLIRIRVTDDAGLSAEREERLPILNARPIIDAVRDSGPVEEGTPIRIEVVARDPGDDPLSYSFDLDNDGMYEIADSPDFFVEHVFAQQGFYTIGVRVRDDSGDFAVSIIDVEVTNAAPRVRLVAPEFVDEGEVFELRATAEDIGADVLLYDWDLDGDEAYDLIGTRDPVRMVSLPQEGVYTLRVRVRDDVGSQALASTQVLVRNVPPTAEVEIRSPGEEGSEIPVRVTARDAGGDDLRYSYDFDGDGTFELENVDRDQVPAIYDDQGVYTLRVLVDDGTDTATAEAMVEITNVAPRVTLETNSPVTEGSDLVFNGTATDPGADVISIDWDLDGDGEVDAQGEVVRTIRAPDDSRFLATLTARDEDGGESSAQAQVIIINVAPTLVDLAEPPPAVEGLPYNLVMQADDPAGELDPLRFALIDPPPGVDIEAETGRFNWTPSFEHARNTPVLVRVRVEDGDGGRDETELRIPVLFEDVDGDGLPDTYERRTCDGEICLDPADPADGAADPDGDGRDNRTEFEQGTDPFTYEGPTQPDPISPEEGERVRTLTPELVVTAVEAPPGEPPAIEFQVFDTLDAIALEQPLVASDPIAQAPDVDRVSWQPAQGLLLEDRTYWWRARGLAGMARSEWTVPRSFRTNATNEKPGTPELRAPADGTVSAELKPTLEAIPSEDPDGDELVFVFTLYRIDDEGTAVPESSELGEVTEGVVRFVPEAALIENRVYGWDVVARDELGETSEPSERWTFTINTANQPPTKPEIRAPSGEGFVTDLQVLFVAGGSSDNDSPSIAYVFTLRDEMGAEMAVSEPLAPDGDEASWRAPMPLNEDGFHTIEVVATDGSTNSEVASLRFFASADDEPPPAPTLISPADDTEGFEPGGALVWTRVEDPERTQVTYECSYCRENAGCAKSERSTSLNVIPQDLEAGATYRWSVIAFDETGQQSEPSISRSFTVESGGGGDAGGCGCRATSGGAAPASLALLALAALSLRRRRIRRP